MHISLIFLTNTREGSASWRSSMGPANVMHIILRTFVLTWYVPSGCHPISWNLGETTGMWSGWSYIKLKFHNRMSNNFGCKRFKNNSSKYGQIRPIFRPTVRDARPSDRGPRALGPYRMEASGYWSTSGLKNILSIDRNIYVISLKFWQNRPPPKSDPYLGGGGSRFYLRWKPLLGRHW